MSTLLPAGRKFCKITQNRPKKDSDWQGTLAAVRRRFWTKAAEKNILWFSALNFALL
jgi:hypothetical protein